MRNRKLGFGKLAIGVKIDYCRRVDWFGGIRLIGEGVNESSEDDKVITTNNPSNMGNYNFI